MLGAAVIALIMPSAALAAFPGAPTPTRAFEPTRPDDPDFDPCEPDNAGGPHVHERLRPAVSSASVSRRARTQNTATYHNPLARTASARWPRTRWRAAPHWARSPASPPIAPGSTTTGASSVQVAILDTGIAWDRNSLRRRSPSTAASCRSRTSSRHPGLRRLAGAPAARSPPPTTPMVTEPSTSWTTSNDPRITSPPAPHGDAIGSTPSDLIAAFSDGDRCRLQRLRRRHRRLGLLRQRQRPLRRLQLLQRHLPRHRAAPRTPGRRATTARAASGSAPRCQIVPLRVWDTFVVDTNNFGAGGLSTRPTTGSRSSRARSAG